MHCLMNSSHRSCLNKHFYKFEKKLKCECNVAFIFTIEKCTVKLNCVRSYILQITKMNATLHSHFRFFFKFIRMLYVMMLINKKITVKQYSSYFVVVVVDCLLHLQIWAATANYIRTKRWIDTEGIFWWLTSIHISFK